MKKILLFILVACCGLFVNAQEQAQKNAIGLDSGTIFVPSNTFPTEQSTRFVDTKLNSYYNFTNPLIKNLKLYQRFDKVTIDGSDFIFKVTCTENDIVSVSVSSSNPTKLSALLHANGGFAKQSPMIACAKNSNGSDWSYLGCLVHVLTD